MIVLDTCTVIWLTTEPAELSAPAVRAIQDALAKTGLSISGITLYELAWLIENERIEVAMSSEAYLAEIESRFTVLSITTAVARLAAELPDTYPGDPMDRIIGATALAHGAPLITRDKLIRRSKAVPVIW